MGFHIEGRNENGEWDKGVVGDPSANAFKTEAAAEDEIENLRLIGPEWESAEYRVVEDEEE